MTTNENMKAAVEHAQILAKTIDMLLNGHGPRTVGFVLLFFPFNEIGEAVNYVSTANRNDMKLAFEEILARWDEIKPN